MIGRLVAYLGGLMSPTVPPVVMDTTNVPAGRPAMPTAAASVEVLGKPILDLIGTSEGTDRKRGYNETLGYGAYTGGDVDLVGRTLAQIDQLQTEMLDHPNNYMNSSAIGRYQIVRTTLRKLKADLKLPESAKFDKAMQDRLGAKLLVGRGLYLYLGGSLSEFDFIDHLAQEWASLPTRRGTGYYGNQRASVDVAQVRAALVATKKQQL